MHHTTSSCNSEVIKMIFNTMDCGENIEECKEALDWLQTKFIPSLPSYVISYGSPEFRVKDVVIQLPDQSDDIIEKNIKSLSGSTQWFKLPGLRKRELIRKFAKEIQKNSEMLCQLEMCFRNVLKKDTKKSIVALCDILNYYSGFAVRGTQNKTTGEVAVGILHGHYWLPYIGYLLGPALAAGQPVCLVVGRLILPVTAFLLELSEKIGFPKNVIKMASTVPESPEVLSIFTNDHVDTVTIFDNVYKDFYRQIENLTKNVYVVCHSKTPVIVFESADLDSACEIIVESIWSHRGMLPWGARDILVQESVYNVFIEKIKSLLSNKKIGNPFDKQTDIPETRCPLTNAVAAEGLKTGIEVFQHGNSKFKATLLIGGKLCPNNVLAADKFNSVPFGNIVAFRHANEAVALANNSRHGFAASVWTENLNLANEMASKLNVNNVWINCFNRFTPEVAISAWKGSGRGHFGGTEGFQQWANHQKLGKFELVASPGEGDVDLTDTMTKAKKIQAVWSKIPRRERILKLQDLTFSTSGAKSEAWINEWIDAIFDYSCGNYGRNSAFTSSGFDVKIYRVARGLLAIEQRQAIETHNKKLLVAALTEGNVVILLNQGSQPSNFYEEISNQLGGVIIVLNCSPQIAKAVTSHKELNSYIGVGLCNPFGSDLVNYLRYSTCSENWEDIVNKVTLSKNVWSSGTFSFA